MIYVSDAELMQLPYSRYIEYLARYNRLQNLSGSEYRVLRHLASCSRRRIKFQNVWHYAELNDRSHLLTNGGWFACELRRDLANRCGLSTQWIGAITRKLRERGWLYGEYVNFRCQQGEVGYYVYVLLRPITSLDNNINDEP